ncbi:hypothetical protein MKW98_027630, partial [Papaver atlanticum]
AIKKACAFRDSYENGDDLDSHKAFGKMFRLPYTLLTDEGNKVTKEWGVPSDLFGTLHGRQTYIPL